MADPKDPTPVDPRTIFVPSAPATDPGKAEAPPHRDETVFAPSASEPPNAEPAPAAGQVAIGMVLNGMFKVKRFIARGGMAEVYEGVNANDEADQVAIKVILPALAADPNVQIMFRSEARTLMKLSHPALVQYRVLAQEPALGLFYIVTELINGPSLAEKLGAFEPTSEALAGLIRRLAEGLGAAHELGAVHRDMSPDNVLLPDGRLERAKIVDFGIAKNLDPGSKTTIGDGFAGKLGYVAPEQFGEFDRKIGPWTDVYSLALVILSVALGRNVDMGSTLWEAVMKRTAGPDLSPIPPDLRPLLQRMLVADPAQRLRSMEEVIDVLDGLEEMGAPSLAAPVAIPAPSPKPRRSVPLIIGAVAGVSLLAVVGLVVVMSGGKPAKTPSVVAARQAEAPLETPVTAGPSETLVPHAEAARRAIEASLLSIPCSWLNLISASDTPGGVAVRLTGVAGSTREAQSYIARAIRQAGATPADIDIGGVDPIGQSVCSALDALRPFRADSSAADRRLVSSQEKYTMEKNESGKLVAKAVIEMRIGDPSLDAALFGIEQSGRTQRIIPDRKSLTAAVASQAVDSLGGDNYRFPVVTDNVGWSGMLLLTGKGPFDKSLLEAPVTARDAAWRARVAQALAKGGWKAEMVWYQSVLPTG